jgi:hypothetical protein
MKDHGLVRVEVTIPAADAGVIREAARALRAEAPLAARLRELLTPDKPSLKALLAQAPLDDLDLTRDADTGRDLVW